MELLIVITAIFIGVHYGGIGLGIMGALGVGVLTFGFHVQPTSPPVDVILIIVAVITAIATVQAAGGMDYLINIAKKILRKNPKHITFLGPLVSYIFTFIAGTGHITYSILPIIAEVARGIGIRPERPLCVSTLASHLGITASPISAATVLMVQMLSPEGVTLSQILIICVPATLIGLLIATFVASKKGKELADDPVYQQRLKENPDLAIDSGEDEENYQPTFRSKLSVMLLLTGTALIVFFGSFPALRPAWEVNGQSQSLEMATLIEIIMLSMAAIIIMICRVDVEGIVKQSTFMAGVKAVIAIFGIAWLGDTFFNAHLDVITGGIQELVSKAPWMFGFAIFAMSVMLFSQAATVRAIMPLGLTLGITPLSLVAMFPMVNGLFFIPSYPIEVSAVNFDRTGTTRIGRFVLNHSFIIPGLVGVFSSMAVGLGIRHLLF
jgi:anaerobic C4-dicarboxylate transporter DcuA